MSQARACVAIRFAEQTVPRAHEVLGQVVRGQTEWIQVEGGWRHSGGATGWMGRLVVAAPRGSVLVGFGYETCSDTRDEGPPLVWLRATWTSRHVLHWEEGSLLANAVTAHQTDLTPLRDGDLRQLACHPLVVPDGHGLTAFTILVSPHDDPEQGTLCVSNTSLRVC